MTHVQSYHVNDSAITVEDVIEVEARKETVHGILEENAPAVICGECNQTFTTEILGNEHMRTHDHRCYKCNFKSEDLAELDKHEKDVHKFLSFDRNSPDKDVNFVGDKKRSMNDANNTESHNKETQPIRCEQCEHSFSNQVELKDHKCSSNIPGTKSDLCEFVSNDVSSIVEHIRTAHKAKQQCNFCKFEAIEKNILKEHMMDKHPDLTLWNTIAYQMDSIQESFVQFEAFKNQLKDVLNNLIDGTRMFRQTQEP